jgi:hypothetical protein
MFEPKENGIVVEGKPHTWMYCPQCKTWAVRCGKCQNVCCNGGSGRSIQGFDCDCTEAYDIQDQWFDSPEYETWRNSDDYKIKEAEAIEEMNHFWEDFNLQAKSIK